MTKEQVALDNIHRELTKRVGAVKISNETGIVYQTVCKFYNGGNVKPETENYIAQGCLNVTIEKIAALKKELRTYEQYLPILKDWVNVFE